MIIIGAPLKLLECDGAGVMPVEDIERMLHQLLRKRHLRQNVTVSKSTLSLIRREKF